MLASAKKFSVERVESVGIISVLAPNAPVYTIGLNVERVALTVIIAVLAPAVAPRR
tara:strand:+ start:122 stop:289 length:168 start_codon:yes stop_codon:yes gene_type:complete